MAKAMDVANFLIHLRDADEEHGQYFSLSNLKLQKLLYYCQGGHFKWDQEQLIEDAYFEPWDYGPVIRDVYRHFKKYGQNDLYADININSDSFSTLRSEEKETIQAVWEQLKSKSAFDLVNSTHEEEPWKNSFNKEIFIDNCDIRKYFTQSEEGQ